MMKSIAGVMVLLFAYVAEATADTFELITDTTWRAIGPAGNLQGRPINSVGLEWESANVGWNTDLSFNDSDAAGWRNAKYNPEGVWVDGDGSNGSTPAYFRKVFTIEGPPMQALLDLSVDDDAQAYINGVLVVDDHNGRASRFDGVDVRAAIWRGTNLVAVKAHDSYGLYEHLYAALNVQYVPEPSALLLLSTAGFGLLVYARRRRRRRRRTTSPP